MKFLRKTSVRGTRADRVVALTALALCGCGRDDWSYRGRDASSDVAEAATDVPSDRSDATADVAADLPLDVPADLAADLPLDVPTDRADAPTDVTSELICEPPNLLCGGQCIDPRTNTSHCGMCARLCPPANACMGGACMVVSGCNADVCGGACADGVCSQPAALTVGRGHVCARFDSGRIRCWGGNTSGQLGRASISRAETTPALVLGVAEADAALSRVSGVSAGTTHVCAVINFDSAEAVSNVRCWGNNDARQVGQAAVAIVNRPAETGVTHATAIASGAQHTCALRVLDTRSSISCWGSNAQGQIGTGVVDAVVATPTEIPPSSFGSPAPTFLGVAAGAQHTCAWDATRVFCWGDNDALALGRSMGRFNLPGLANTPAGPVEKVVAGEDFTCASIGPSRDGVVWCWGSSVNGRNGVTSLAAVGIPTRVPGLTGVIDIAAGRAHACALLASGEVRCWGHNHRGQLGVASPTESPSPLPLASMLRFDAIAAGGDTTCGLVYMSHAVVCWGDNSSGQLAIPTTTTSRHLPQRVMF